MQAGVLENNFFKKERQRRINELNYKTIIIRIMNEQNKKINMKYFILSVIAAVSRFMLLQAQNKYPEPEFSKEVYYLKKDSVNSLMRLEKGSSKMESKTKMGGIGGYEMGYVLDGEKSSVRLNRAPDLSFVFSTGASARSASSPEKDSMMRANGMDPSMMSRDGRYDGWNE